MCQRSSLHRHRLLVVDGVSTSQAHLSALALPYSDNGKLQVVLVDFDRVLPARGSELAAGFGLCSRHAGVVEAGVYAGIASRFSVVPKGIDVAQGVVDAHYRKELQIILSNATSTDCR